MEQLDDPEDMISRSLTRIEFGFFLPKLRDFSFNLDMSAVFISYRRDGTEEIAHLIKAKFDELFGGEAAMLDVDGFVFGKDYRIQIDNALATAETIIVVIGPNWLSALEERELSGKEDWVRYEVTQALKAKSSIVPVLVHGAAMPTADELPEDLKLLGFCNNKEIRGGAHLPVDLLDLARRVLENSRPDPSPSEPADPLLRKGRLALICTVLFWFGLMFWREWLPPQPVDKLALHHLLYDNCWVTYDPSGKKLDLSRSPVYPQASEMEIDLAQIKSAGFSGILTNSSHLPMTVVPKMAKNMGLNVIMGVWDPVDRAELERAIRQAAYVDAYCIGDFQAQQSLPVEVLEQAVRLVKKRTGKPAAVSDLVKNYGDRLARTGDWLFPDAHLTLGDSLNIARNVELFMQSTSTMAKFAQALDCPLIFKSVAYPHKGFAGASDELQRDFFRLLLANLNDPQRGHGARTSIVVQEAFDAPWKVGPPFLPWDPFTGLLEHEPATGRTRAKPAVAEILQRYPHLHPELFIK